MNTIEPLLVKPGETRNGNILNIFGDQVLVKLAGNDTNGELCVLENVIPFQAGPPLHRHTRENETFYVVEGEFLVEVDGKQFRAGAGDIAFAPRGTAHTFQNLSSKPGRMIVYAQPAGVDLFFAELSAATEGMRELDLSVIIPLFQKYGLELLGPPLAARGK